MFSKYLLFLVNLFFFINVYAGNDSSISSENDILINLVTNRGVVKVSLFKQKEPELVNFFLKYVNSGFYNNIIFHRIIDGFIIQGGIYDSQFVSKETQLKSQLSFQHSDLKNNIGTFVLILHKGACATTSPQFFINLADNSSLNSFEGNFEYDVIGKVVSGMDVIEKIAHIKVGQREGMYSVPFYPNEAVLKEVSVQLRE